MVKDAFAFCDSNKDGLLSQSQFTKMLVFLLSLCFTLSGAQELTLPPGFDPAVFMDSVYSDIKAACPSGIEKCECMNAPGVFTEGPFDPRENPVAPS